MNLKTNILKTTGLRLLFLMGSMASFSQTTSIPDANFEAYLETHNADGEVVTVGAVSSMGDGIENNNLVTTANINMVTGLDVSGNGIAYLRGIEDFVLLETLNCSSNELTVLDLTKNSSLTSLNTKNNSLVYLNVKNGNTLAIATFNALENENLSCIQIDEGMIPPFSWEYDSREEFNMEFNLVCSLTYVPDAYFESYLETHNADGEDVTIGDSSSMGDGIENNTLVTTANISEVTSLTVNELSISDLTGIEAFAALIFLDCNNNSLSSLNSSNNMNLEQLYCSSNNLSGSLDVSAHTSLTSMDVSDNNLTLLNVKNGNNSNFTYFAADANPNLTCIVVDVLDYSTTNWTSIDTTSTFVNSQEECASLGVEGIETLNVSIYPNPSKGTFTIEVLEASDLILYSAIGKEVFRKPLKSGQNQINAINLSRGLYFVNVTSNEKVMTKKLISE